MKISILIPYYNESLNIYRTVNLIIKALENSQINVFEILILDDGSKDLTDALQAQLLSLTNTKLIRFEHQGRYKLRISGLEIAAYNHVLLCDARVRLAPNSLAFLLGNSADTEMPRNGHVIFDPTAKAWMVFWESMSRIVWPQVFSRNFSQGHINEQNFNSWPKGTGLFFARADVLLQAMRNTQSLFHKDELSSDDTLVLMQLARTSGILYDSSFSAYYLPRTKFSDFRSHIFERGTHAVDSFGHNLSAISLGLGLVAVMPIFFVVALVSFRSKTLFLMYSGATAVAFLFILSLGIALHRRLPIKHVLSLLMMLPLVAPIYLVGLYRGLGLALYGKLGGLNNAKETH